LKHNQFLQLELFRTSPGVSLISRGNIFVGGFMSLIKMVFILLIVLATPVFSAESPLPKKMEGRWVGSQTGREGWADAELIRMDSPAKALLKVSFTDSYCSRFGEVTAELKDGFWEFMIPDGPGDRCNKVLVKVKPVEGKNRLEGGYRTVDGRYGKLYYEWE
jgi:hypothetical protein